MAKVQPDSKLPRGVVLPALPEHIFRRQHDEVRSALQEQQKELLNLVEGWAQRLEHSALERRRRHEVQVIQFFEQQPCLEQQPCRQLVGAAESGPREEMVTPPALFLADVGQEFHPHTICEAPPDVPRPLSSASHGPKHLEREREPGDFLQELPGALAQAQAKASSGVAAPEMCGVVPSPPDRMPEPLGAASPALMSKPQDSGRGNCKTDVDCLSCSDADESNEGGQKTEHNNTGSATLASVVNAAVSTPKRTAKRGFTSLTLSIEGERAAEKKYAPNTIGWLVHSKPFVTLVSVLILVNAVCIGAQAEYLLRQSWDHPGYVDAGAWEWASRFFTVFFTIELVFRIADEKFEFLSGEQKQWNIFDGLLVVFSLADWVLQSSNLPNLSFIRVLRVVRSIRILRLVRVLRSFHSFRVLVSSLIHSVLSLVWVVLLLLLACYTFAVLMLYGVVEYISDPLHHDTNTINMMMEYYGSVPRGLLTLFMGISGGVDWGDMMRPLLEIHWVYALIWSFYIFAVVFGMLNVVTGVFVARAHELSLNDREIMVQQELALERSYAKHIIGFFHEADKDGSGELCWEELDKYLQDETVKAYFATLQLDVGQAKSLFRLLDTDESDAVGIDEFVEGCMRLRGAAKSIDVNMLLLESEKLMHTFRAFMDGIELRLKHIEEHVGFQNSDQGLLATGPITQQHERMMEDLAFNGGSRPSSRSGVEDMKNPKEKRSILGRGLQVLQSLAADEDNQVEHIHDWSKD